MARRGLMVVAVTWVIVGVCTTSAFAATSSVKVRPRIGGALGIVPALNAQNIASGSATPLTYHGGSVMGNGITVHTIFWDPQGYPRANETTVKAFFSDVAADSGGGSPGTCTTAACNTFTVLNQFGQGTTPGHVTPGQYNISYNPSLDSIDDTDAYPTTDNCASANNVGICLTDAQVQQEVDKIASSAGNPRGLTNLWHVFLPPNVDECITAGVCATNVFAGYHSLSSINGHGLTIYAVTIDPIIQLGGFPPQGNDPEGNPDGEQIADIAAHETVEAMTDPEGVGWMDPNGFEAGDKCEFGPQRGRPIGTAANGSPFNQVINAQPWLIQEMWSNDDGANGACVQTTSQTAIHLPLPQVNLTQFSDSVSGNTELNVAGIPVQVAIVRSDASGDAVTVAQGSTTTAADGSWTVSGLSHYIGDDRDEIDITYNNGTPGAGVPAQPGEVILTGNGGNPFTESGWTGWTALDNGAFLTNTDPVTGKPSLTLAPCFQTGVLAATVNATAVPTLPQTPTDFCNTQTDAANLALFTPVGSGDQVTQSSNDNRAFQSANLPTANPTGGLVKLTVPVGEPDAASLFVSLLATFSPDPSVAPTGPSGFPTCTADLEAGMVRCTGLVPGATYTVTDGGTHVAGSADKSGTLTVSLAAHGGDTVHLNNGSRDVTVLHIASLKVKITGEQTVLAGGSCQAGEYYGGPLSTEPTNSSAGFPSVIAGGAALTGEVCPLNGDATGLPTSLIAQTDEQSGGVTRTEVPDVQDTSPMEGETVYGNFTAIAESGFTGANNNVIPDATSTVALTITPAGGGTPIVVSGNVDTATGQSLNGLKPGTYTAKWVLTDANGDTRTVTTRFIEASALQGQPGQPGQQGARGPQGPRGPRGPSGPRPTVSCRFTNHHKKIKCTVSFPKTSHGTLRMVIARGGRVAALGHGRVTRGKATITMNDRRKLTRGAWKITLVFAQPRKPTTTTVMSLRVR